MKIKIEKYAGQFKIVSIALDEETKEDLIADQLNFLFVSDRSAVLYPDGELLTEEDTVVDMLLTCNNYDVFELWEDGTLYRCFDASSKDNYFFASGKCNSNCIMCPSPEVTRRRGQNASVQKLIEVARHMPSDVQHLTITGGEPFMVGEEIFEFIAFLKRKFLDTEFLFLTNGRVFASGKFAVLFAENMPENTIVGIPIHGSCESVHDTITQAKGSFLQTCVGLQRLLKLGVRIELRVVLSKLNIADIDNIAELIIKNFPNIEYVSVIAMEMTGNAHMNRDIIWQPYREIFRNASKSIQKLIMAGINVRLYNFPLCVVDRKYWYLCEKSISPSKIRYGDSCEKCRVYDACGGVFAGTFQLEKGELTAIV